jgi:hypothetical protein
MAFTLPYEIKQKNIYMCANGVVGIGTLNGCQLWRGAFREVFIVEASGGQNTWQWFLEELL